MTMAHSKDTSMITEAWVGRDLWQGQHPEVARLKTGHEHKTIFKVNDRKFSLYIYLQFIINWF